ncbi:hypothetical protein HDV01_001389 [Terramyces sp. JEL0728]|nr:hypothetical protein HDV01_001389 [Terramyces sp. JEL0728]
MAVVLQSIWTGLECQGIPDSLILFNTTFGPEYYAWNPISFCGYSKQSSVFGDGCCVSSIDLSYTSGMQSWLNTALVEEWTFDKAAFKSANNQTYCMVQSQDVYFNTSSEILYGVNAVLYRNTGKCIYGAVCSGAWVDFYKDLECTELIEHIDFNSSPQAIYPSKYLGNVTITTYTFTEAKNYVDWTTLQPGAELVPGFGSASGAFSLLCSILSVIVALIVFGYYSYGFYLGRKTQLMAALTLVNLARTVLAIIYYYVVFPYSETVTQIITALDCMRIIFLGFNFLSCGMLVKILNLKSNVYKAIPYIFVTLVFIAIETPLIYIHIVMLTPSLQTDAVAPTYNEVVLFAYYMNGANTLFLFLFDSLPIVMLLIKLLLKQQQMQKQKEGKINYKTIIRKYWVMLVVLVIQITNGVAYITVDYEADNTLWLGNDRGAIAITLFYLFIINWHNFAVIILFEYLRHFTWELVNPPASTNLLTNKPRMLMDEVNNSTNSKDVANTIKGDKTILQ